MTLDGLHVVVLAAGKGTRMRSARPKVLHSVCGRSLVERVIRAANGLKPDRTVAVIGHGREAVEEELSSIGKKLGLDSTSVSSVVQTEQRGTGHAVQTALPEIKTAKHVLILPGDVPLLRTETLSAAVRAYQASGCKGVSFITFEPPVVTGFGRIVRDNAGSVQGIVEEKDASDKQREITEANSSIYLVNTEFLVEALGSLSDDNVQGELYLTDIIKIAVEKGVPVNAIVAEDYRDTLGANSRSELSALEAIQRKRNAERLMSEGVTLEDPENVYLDDDVVVGQDSFIGAGTHLKGLTRLGENVTVEANCFFIDSEVGSGSQIKFSSAFESAKLEGNCQIGPFARLRPGTELAEGVKIGNFVETKKSTFGVGSKANHLAYVGDATVGAGVNIGAGTITCNYDGQNKSQTVLDDGVFIGSNSCLVAPVRVGAGAFVGAGSTITKDIPADALGVGRGKQINKEGWAKARRKK